MEGMSGRGPSCRRSDWVRLGLTTRIPTSFSEFELCSRRPRDDNVCARKSRRLYAPAGGVELARKKEGPTVSRRRVRMLLWWWWLRSKERHERVDGRLIIRAEAEPQWPSFESCSYFSFGLLPFSVSPPFSILVPPASDARRPLPTITISPLFLSSMSLGSVCRFTSQDGLLSE